MGAVGRNTRRIFIAPVELFKQVDSSILNQRLVDTGIGMRWPGADEISQVAHPFVPGPRPRVARAPASQMSDVLFHRRHQ